MKDKACRKRFLAKCHRLVCLGIAGSFLFCIEAHAQEKDAKKQGRQVPLVHASKGKKSPSKTSRKADARKGKKLNIRAKIGIVDPHEPIDDIISRVRAKQSSGRFREIRSPGKQRPTRASAKRPSGKNRATRTRTRRDRASRNRLSRPTEKRRSRRIRR